ncbi:PREDICTED: uncharacterized protein LOC109359676 [Lupinus angustifolius]|uniref:uncharacterized protein LOC109359676 n=1 Tax=Lupinus angustifolius TaxID=3871 RepID=UPI00092E8CC0|nr:PREDICTED: uncharacterized protein LOC109359676 [Lupinus angustifolius]
MSRNVSFYENVFPFSSQTDLTHNHEGIPLPTSSFNHDDHYLDYPILDHLNHNQSTHTTDISSLENSSSLGTDRNPNISTRYSTRMRKTPSYLQDYHFLMSTSNVFSKDPNSKYPLSFVLYYDRLNKIHKSFISNVTCITEPKSYDQASQHPHWVDAITEELNAVEKNQTSILTKLPKDKRAIGWNDMYEILSNKHLLDEKFSIKDLGNLKYFLGLEVAKTKKGINLCQRKYIIKLLQETSLLGSKPSSTPMDSGTRLHSKSGSSHPNITAYRRLIGRLVYLTHIRLDIAYVVSHLSQFLSEPTIDHYKAGLRVLRYLKSAPRKGLLLKQNIVLWPLQDMKHNRFYTLYCDNEYALYLAANPVFHERTKHIEMDYHYIRENVTDGIVHLLPISTDCQIADVFTKALPLGKFHNNISKLGLYDIHSPACGGC